MLNQYSFTYAYSHVHRLGCLCTYIVSSYTVILYTIPAPMTACGWQSQHTRNTYTVDCITSKASSTNPPSSTYTILHKFGNTINTFTTPNTFENTLEISYSSHATHKPANIAITTAKNQKNVDYIYLYNFTTVEKWSPGVASVVLRATRSNSVIKTLENSI